MGSLERLTLAPYQRVQRSLSTRADRLDLTSATDQWLVNAVDSTREALPPILLGLKRPPAKAFGKSCFPRRLSVVLDKLYRSSWILGSSRNITYRRFTWSGIVEHDLRSESDTPSALTFLVEIMQLRHDPGGYRHRCRSRLHAPTSMPCNVGRCFARGWKNGKNGEICTAALNLGQWRGCGAGACRGRAQSFNKKLVIPERSSLGWGSGSSG